MTDRYDVVVVGGGIVGLATARSLQERRPALAVAVVEKEARLGTHQTGHNSGVLHSGLYYRPGSLKARLCVDGRRRMLDYCRSKGIPHRVSGKVVVATSREEIPRLEDLAERGAANGVAGIERLGRAGIADHEPAAAGLAALWVPETGVVDFSAVAAAIGADLLAAGAAVVTSAGVDRVERTGDGVLLGAGGREVRARLVVNAAGLHADRVARMAGTEPPARIVPFRGEYRVLAEAAADRIRGLLYPVPDPRFPFLGVHFTRKVDGVVEVGPNAVLALGREHYRGARPEVGTLVEAVAYRGFRRLALRHAVSGAAEMVRSASRSLYAREARRLVPGLRASDLRPGGAGVRAQAVFPDGTLADDFVIASGDRFVHVISAPSPAATAALAIGDHLAGVALAALGD